MYLYTHIIYIYIYIHASNYTADASTCGIRSTHSLRRYRLYIHGRIYIYNIYIYIFLISFFCLNALAHVSNTDVWKTACALPFFLSLCLLLCIIDFYVYTVSCGYAYMENNMHVK